MGVRVRIKIILGDNSVETVALVNTGFESDVPEILVPITLAEKLSVWPSLPDGTIVETYKSASGLMRVYRIRGIKASLIAEGVKTPFVDAYLVVSEESDEVLLNDQIISRLGIVIEDPARGEWRLRGETKIRVSEVSQTPPFSISTNSTKT